MINKSNWVRVGAICLLLVLATLAAYWQVRGFDFTSYDDQNYVSQNPMVVKGLTLEGARWALTTTYFSYWHPLTWLSHMADCQFSGLNAGRHHLTNVFIHAANGVILFLLLFRITGAMGRSAFVAAAFALHPLHVESVAWVAERKDVLSTFFWFATMWAYAWFSQRPGVGRYLWVLFLFVCGLMSKPMLVTLPCVLLLMDYWPLGRLRLFPFSAAPPGGEAAVPEWGSGARCSPVPLLRLILEKVPFLALAICSSVITFLGVRSAGNVLSAEKVSWTFRLTNVPVSYVRYIAKMIMPEDMVFLYPMPERWEMWQVVGSVLLLLCVTLLVLALAKPRPYLPFGWLWYLGTLVPTIGIIPVGLQSIADRYTYVPLVGLFIMAAWSVGDLVAHLAAEWPQRKLALAGLSLLVLAGLAAGTRRQTRHWENSVTLYTHAVNATTNNAVAHYNLGLTLFLEGQIREPLEQFREALRIDSKFEKAHNNLGRTLAALGRWQEATNHYSEALRLEPNDADVHFNFARALAAFGQPDAALLRFADALRLKPDDPEIHSQMAAVLQDQRKTAEAIRHDQEALHLKPDLVDALNNLAWLRATSADAEFRDGGEAVRLAQRACEVTVRKSPQTLMTLAAAFAESGQFGEAAKTAAEAESLAPRGSALAETIKKLLQLFQSGQPYHEPAGPVSIQ